MKDADHPFYAFHFAGIPTFHCDAESRMAVVRKLEEEKDIEGLRKVLRWVPSRPLQKTVGNRAESALRRLQSSERPRTITGHTHRQE